MLKGGLLFGPVVLLHLHLHIGTRSTLNSPFDIFLTFTTMKWRKEASYCALWCFQQRVISCLYLFHKVASNRTIFNHFHQAVRWRLSEYPTNFLQFSSGKYTEIVQTGGQLKGQHVMYLLRLTSSFVYFSSEKSLPLSSLQEVLLPGKNS